MELNVNQKISLILLATFFIVGGTLHFIFPLAYSEIMPAWLPAHKVLVLVSGICEIAGGIGVLFPLTRRLAGMGLILLAIAVLPANVQMLLNAHNAGKDMLWQTLLVLRLPLQFLLIYWIWRVSLRGQKLPGV